MIKKITLFIFALTVVSQTFGQVDYYITKVNFESYFNDELVNLDSTKYFYDDQERIERIESIDDYSIYTYDGNIVTTEDYSTYDDQIYSRQIEIQNDDGYRVVFSTYFGFSGNLELRELDSFTRNNNNQIVRYVTYEDLGYGFEKEIEENTIYNSLGYLISVERIFYYNGQIFFVVTTSNVYNSEDKIENIIRKTEDLMTNTSYSDTTSYFYANDELVSIEVKDYSAEGFNKCSLTEYENNGNLTTSIRSGSINIDCSDYLIERKNETTSNEDLLSNFESSVSFIYNENNMFEKSSSLHYTQEGILGDDEIALNSVQLSFDGIVESFKNNIKRKYKKSELVSDINIKLQDEVIIYPNNVGQNDIFSYKIADIAFDNIKIIDLTGQTIAHEPVINKANLNFNAPSVTGMYFVQLYNGKTPVTKVAKLIVN